MGPTETNRLQQKPLETNRIFLMVSIIGLYGFSTWALTPLSRGQGGGARLPTRRTNYDRIYICVYVYLFNFDSIGAGDVSS